MMPDVTQVHICYAVQQLDQLLISLCHGSTQLITVHIKVIKQAGKLTFGGCAFCRFLNIAEDTLQRLVQVFIGGSSGSDIAE